MGMVAIQESSIHNIMRSIICVNEAYPPMQN